MNLLTLIIWLIAVESGGDDSAVGKNQELGCLGITPIMVDDVNRIIGWNHFTLEDRLDRGKSIEMCQIYLTHYNARTFEQGARMWNGGGQGHRKPETVKYWEKVKREMRR